MKTAKEIMTAPATSVKKGVSLKDVLQLLAERRISGVPIVDDEDKVVGVISDTDIIRYANQISVVPLSNLSGWVNPYSDINDMATVRKNFDRLHSTSVEQVMTKKIYSVNQSDCSTEVARLMNRRNINRIPVVDDNNKLVGIITRSDMVQCMAEL